MPKFFEKAPKKANRPNFAHVQRHILDLPQDAEARESLRLAEAAFQQTKLTEETAAQEVQRQRSAISEYEAVAPPLRSVPSPQQPCFPVTGVSACVQVASAQGPRDYAPPYRSHSPPSRSASRSLDRGQQDPLQDGSAHRRRGALSPTQPHPGAQEMPPSRGSRQLTSWLVSWLALRPGTPSAWTQSVRAGSPPPAFWVSPPIIRCVHLLGLVLLQTPSLCDA